MYICVCVLSKNVSFQKLTFTETGAQVSPPEDEVSLGAVLKTMLYKKNTVLRLALVGWVVGRVTAAAAAAAPGTGRGLRPRGDGAGARLILTR